MYFQRSLVFSVFALASAAVVAAAPVATTSNSTSITTSSAQLNGTGNPNGEAATGWFRYSTTNPGTCNDSFGTRSPPSSASDAFLGSGFDATDYSSSISGLAPVTTYYFCALVGNAQGTSFGAVLPLTTAGTPTVATNPATFLASTSVTVNGSANPRGADTTGSFRYSTTNPGTCNDSFGTRWPPFSVSDPYLGSGTIEVAFSLEITGLAPATTYYFCAIGRNGSGAGFGTVLSFTTVAVAPTVSTGGATDRTGTSATLNATANANGNATVGWFRYGTANPGTCNDSFGTRAPSSGGTNLGSGTASVAYAQAIGGLSAGTTYYVCAIAGNSVGISMGTVISFTMPLPPSATTSAASSLTTTSASLNGSSNPNGAVTTGWFRYSTVNPGTCNDAFGTRAPLSGGSDLGSGLSSQPYSQPVTGLSAGTPYYFCSIASNSEGLSFGTVVSFTTRAAPTVSTDAVTFLASTNATLNGSANPRGADTLGWFRYSTTNPGTCNDSFGTYAGPSGPTAGYYLGFGTVARNYWERLSGLTPATTYYFCAIAQNGFGTVFGTVVSFMTTAAAPTVSTGSATDRTGTSATLNATANANGDATVGWFRYSTASPGTCNDSFGTRMPSSGGTNLGSGTSSLPYSQPITGLSAATTYYFCALVSNSHGTSFGAVLTLTTTTAAPTVSTNAVSSLASTTATLNGSANPRGADTLGWFRYSTTNPGTCNDSFGTYAGPSTPSSAYYLGFGTVANNYSHAISGLTPATTYFFCAIGRNGLGTSFGTVLSFTTAAPTVSTDADLAITQTANLNPAHTGKDLVFTLVVTNQGPGAASGVTVVNAIAPDATYVWASPGCTHASGVVSCQAASLGSASSIAFKVVLRPMAAGLFANNVTVAAVQSDPVSGNNSSGSLVTVNSTPAGTPVFRYRLYSPVTLEHHFTTDLNEYTVLGGNGNWVQEGTVGKVLNNPGSFAGVAAIPYYRLYDNGTQWHHWTTDPNEYYTLIEFPSWNAEGVDGYILPTQPAGTVPLYRLLYPFVPGLHHWTIDPVEYNALITTYGWIGEGGSGFVVQ